LFHDGAEYFLVISPYPDPVNNLASDCLFVPYLIIEVLLSTLVGQMSSTSPVMG
jgi:hypothetical protein